MSTGARSAPTAEAVVAVHTLNRARQVAPLLDGLAAALAKHFGARRTAVLVADAGSQDDTEAIAATWCEQEPDGEPARVRVEVEAPAQRARAVSALLRAARDAGARAVALVDADLPEVPEEWLRALLDPVLRGEADYVSPLYARAVSEGTLTSNLLAPLLRALYGWRLQQVSAGCAALSATLLDQCLKSDEAGEWQPHGMEIWLTATAAVGDARLVEVPVGPRPVDTSGPQPDLATTLVRTVVPLFALMERDRARWEEVAGSRVVPRVGDAPPPRPDAGTPSIERMIGAFKLGLKDLLPIWEQVMPEATLGRLYPLALLGADEFTFPPELWARAVIDFAVAYHERRLARDHLVRALTPLYLGRVAAFLGEARARTPARLGEVLERVGEAFEAEKPHLVDRWR